ncbi:MAG: twin-arginine translocase TatA/TatE family subunit [Pseudomonadota bacterium]
MLSGISWPQLLIILVIVLAIFGTKKIRNLGSDLGSVVKGFRSSMNEAEAVKEQLNDDSSASKDDANFDNTPAEEPRKDA